MKTCFKCGVEKPVDAFYCHAAMGDGHLGKCKDCARLDVILNRRARLEYYRSYDRARSTTPVRRANLAKMTARARAQFPERDAVRLRSQRRLVRPSTCELCLIPSRRVECHHFRYDMESVIAWLCKPCHAIADRLRRLQEQRIKALSQEITEARL